MSDPIFFWTQKEQFGAFSNFFLSPIIIDDKSWPTVEHYFQAMKTFDTLAQEAIRNTKSPGQAKKMGRLVDLRSDWESVKINVMLTALRAKFAHGPLKSLLISTGDSHIYEDSPFDKVWGTGVSGEVGSGTNLLGEALMRVRQELTREEK